MVCVYTVLIAVKLNPRRCHVMYNYTLAVCGVITYPCVKLDAGLADLCKKEMGDTETKWISYILALLKYFRTVTPWQFGNSSSLMHRCYLWWYSAARLHRACGVSWVCCANLRWKQRYLFIIIEGTIHLVDYVIIYRNHFVIIQNILACKKQFCTHIN